jgi:RNA polymerase sigma factor (TIGR02999 family)
MPEQGVTGLLLAWGDGDEQAFEMLMPIVYRRLRRMAAGLLRGERSDHTLDATALVHEAYLRLVDLDRVSWQDRLHFFSMSARMMRRILVDHARKRTRTKRGGDSQATPLASRRTEVSTTLRPRELIALDDALNALATYDPLQVNIVELRFFGGLNRDEIAQTLDISSATVTRHWRRARAWLLREMTPKNEAT